MLEPVDTSVNRGRQCPAGVGHGYTHLSRSWHGARIANSGVFGCCVVGNRPNRGPAQRGMPLPVVSASPKMRSLIPIAALALVVGACAPTTPTVMPATPTHSAASPTPAVPSVGDIVVTNRRLGRGINFGNALEAPMFEGQWGLVIRDEYFDLIKKAGFDSVRVPVRWSTHAAAEPPYTIDPALLSRVDEVVDKALVAGLAVVVNIHHYEEMDRDPASHRARFAGLWRQIAARLKDRPDEVVFELLNEPNTAQTAAVWNDVLRDGLREIRSTNPTRAVIIGGANWNNVATLVDLQLPADDRRIIGTFHYYNPFPFTHQGANWVEGAGQWLGTPWDGSATEIAAVQRDLDLAAAWSAKTGRPVYMGEFGAYSRADMDARARWTATVAREAEKRGFSWAYWEFGSGFGAYFPPAFEWREPLLKALIP